MVVLVPELSDLGSYPRGAEEFRRRLQRETGTAVVVVAEMAGEAAEPDGVAFDRLLGQ